MGKTTQSRDRYGLPARTLKEGIVTNKVLLFAEDCVCTTEQSSQDMVTTSSVTEFAKSSAAAISNQCNSTRKKMSYCSHLVDHRKCNSGVTFFFFCTNMPEVQQQWRMLSTRLHHKAGFLTCYLHLFCLFAKKIMSGGTKVSLDRIHRLL